MTKLTVGYNLLVVVVVVVTLVAVIVRVQLVRPVVLAIIIFIVIWIHAVATVVVSSSAHFSLQLVGIGKIADLGIVMGETWGVTRTVWKKCLLCRGDAKSGHYRPGAAIRLRDFVANRKTRLRRNSLRGPWAS